MPISIVMVKKVKLQWHVINNLYWNVNVHPSLAAGILEGNGYQITKLDKKIGVPRAGLVTIALV